MIQEIKASDDIAQLTQQLKQEEKRPIISFFSVNNQNYILNYQNSPRLIEEIFGMAFCIGGSIDMNIDGKGYHISAGDIFALFPGSVVQALSHSDDFECKVLLLDAAILSAIDLSSAMKIFLYIHDHPCATPTKEESEALRHHMIGLKMLDARNDNYYRNEIAERLIVAIAYEIAAIYQRGTAKERTDHTRQEYIFYEFMELLTKHHTTERRVEFYADQLCITPKYFSSIVKRVSGKSAADWITDLVVRSAGAMLTTTRQTIQQISNALNFPNPSFFSQYFKRATGLTPKEFRRQRC